MGRLLPSQIGFLSRNHGHAISVHKHSSPIQRAKLSFIPLLQEGGIGDLIIALPWIESILKDFDYPIKMFTPFPEIAQYFLPWIEIGGDLIKGYRLKSEWDYYIVLSDMVNFKLESNSEVHSFLKPLYEEWIKNFKSWALYINAHPMRANEMAHKALSLNLNRWTLSFYMVNKPYKRFIWEIEGVSIPEKFITIHDGFDASNHYKFDRSTKSWDIGSWNQLVRRFKNYYPDIAVIQLGGIKHRKIEGVDLNLAGQLSFPKSLEYLKSSLLHIDGDSGLVHARRLFKKNSIVLFGPTNIHYFGYPEDINIAPRVCGDCWWKKANWMEQCVKGYLTPKCIDSITPELVFRNVQMFLK